ncbi:type VII secretion-associated serine protease [Microbispora rosea subsp. aerata]|nr:S8 family serine peptidase [Microbispora rosea]GGO25857.1 type VII secretion-associated serine protease [Microbispora rosea subsp. aerata]GIH56932.1 type VII secretion-associated serine protease [Microbispora rosea subsp. aerata]GLJ82858.1 type VII secretion-associated serine protease [Microbispora rosea subsp. aerata]
MLTSLRRRVVAAFAAVLALNAGAFLAPAPAGADDVRLSQQEVLRTLDVDDAWRLTRGRGVTVAVLDSGVDPNHRDLVGSVITGRDFTIGANPRGVQPVRLHGTYMASLIAGHGHGPGGADGIIGVAPEAKVLSVRVILEDEEPGFRTFNSDERYEGVVAKGIRYAVDHGADVINLSLSKDMPTKEERAAIRYAISKGVVLVAAAGNDGAGKRTAPYSYPASIPGVISVAAVTSTLRRASFSNRNSSVMVAAPGVDVLGAGPGDEYWVGRGTSQATALVSGIAALIKSRHPRMSPALVAQALTSSPTHRGRYNTGTGFGVVNAYRALNVADTLSRHRATASGAGVQNPSRPVRSTTDVHDPIVVVRRDTGMILLYGGIALAGFAGSGAGLAVLLVLARRARRRQERDDALPPAPWPTSLPT